MRGAFILVGILLLLFVLTVAPFSETRKTQRTCISIPDAFQTVIYSGAIYRRIRTDTPIFASGMFAYLQSTQPASLFIQDTFKPSYVPIYSGTQTDTAPNWTPPEGVENLLFVDTTQGRQQTDPGYLYFDIYLKPNASGQYKHPAFIEAFCRQGFAVESKILYPDKNGVFSPPPVINSDDIKNWKQGEGIPLTVPGEQSTYYIFAYESEKSTSWIFSTLPKWSTGDLTITVNGQIKNYTVYYVSGSVVKYIGLIDKDISSSDAHVLYRYALISPDFQPIYSQTSIPTASEIRNNLQLETFYYPGINAIGWWNPE